MNWEKLTRDALPVVEQAAKFIRDEAGKVRPEQIEEKFLNGLVSYVDRGAEQLLVEGLSRLLPDATFLTEEEVIKQEESALQWIVDPLDGTTNFLHQLPHYAISVGLKAEGELVAGLVCHVPANEYYYASKGGGAWCNGRPIRVSQKPALREALIATGFPYHDFEREAAWYKAFHQLMLETRGLRRFGAAALDLAWVACGRYDTFFEYGLSPWDVAGGAVLVREAGGVVHDFSGGDSFMEKSELLAGSAAIMEPLEAIIQSAF
jgi:myo-inositol-1(or 4)-monophosphatase